MKTVDLLYETYSAITLNKARSSLTILGIVIGIASVVAMVAIGQGAQKNIEANIQSIGSNLIIVMPGAQRGQQVSTGRGTSQSLTLEDSDAIIANVSGVQAVAPEVSRRYQVTAKGKNTNTSVVGTNPSYPVVRNTEISDGTYFTDAQVKDVAKVAVLGSTARDDLFGEGASVIGQTIRINKNNFTVIGVTKLKGGSGFNSPDDMIFVPISAAMGFLSNDKYVTTISVQGSSTDTLAVVQQSITDLLLIRHKISNPLQADFNTMNQSDIIATASATTGTFTILLTAIAGISLLVGGIGIMNMMLTTVTERTREIGLRKAIGATRTDISLQFLAESVVLTFFGGVLGVILGWIICFIVSSMAGLTTSISLSAVLLAFGVSAGIGIIFGYYPASRAAKLNPIDALRND